MELLGHCALQADTAQQVLLLLSLALMVNITISQGLWMPVGVHHAGLGTIAVEL
jgi:hypothetical protein